MTKSLDIKVNTQQKMKPKHIKTITIGIIILLIIGIGYFIMTNKEQSSKRVVLETTEELFQWPMRDPTREEVNSS